MDLLEVVPFVENYQLLTIIPSFFLISLLDSFFGNFFGKSILMYFFIFFIFFYFDFFWDLWMKGYGKRQAMLYQLHIIR
jgi:hypothetical protein